jgi:DNA-binding transcriptional MocR family regulator
VVPGAAFDADRCRSAIRLCFTAQDEDSIEEGVRRLGTVVRAAMAE